MGVLVTDHWTYSFDLLPWRMIQCELQARGALPHIPGARRWPVWGRHLCQTRCRWSIPKDFIELNFMKGLFPEGLFPSGTSLVAQTVKRLAYNVGDLGSIPGFGKILWRRKWQPWFLYYIQLYTIYIQFWFYHFRKKQKNFVWNDKDLKGTH